MRKTTPGPLLLLALLGAVAGGFLDAALAASGRPILVPPLSLPITVTALGVLVVLLALPVRRAVRERRHNRVDPFYATRVVVLSKASSLAGSLLAGFGVGVLIYLLARPVVTTGSILMAVATSVGAVVLLAGGLIAERMCAVPPEDDDPADQEPSTAHQ